MNENGTEKIKYEGKKFVFGGVEYVMPSLNVKQARNLWPQLLEMNNRGVSQDELMNKFPETLARSVEIIHAALSRNYPSLTVEQVEEFVDLDNFRSLMVVAAGVKERPGALPAAEAEVTETSTGSGSTVQ